MPNTTISLWNINQKKLRSLLKNKLTFADAIELCKIQHSLVHPSTELTNHGQTFFDLILVDIHEACYRKLQDKKFRTILYNIWHSTRIEDITMSILVRDKVQIINTNNWQAKLNTKTTDTGNSMTSTEILQLSSELNIDALIAYRIAVAKQTQKIMNELMPSDLKRKFNASQIRRILAEQAVLKHEKAIWLIDFWGKKNVAGILLMPATRHHMVHINACLRLKKKCKKF